MTVVETVFGFFRYCLMNMDACVATSCKKNKLYLNFANETYTGKSITTQIFPRYKDIRNFILFLRSSNSIHVTTRNIQYFQNVITFYRTKINFVDQLFRLRI